MLTLNQEILTLLARKGRIHLSGVIGSLHWRTPEEVIDAVEALLESDECDGEYIAVDDSNGHWYIAPKEHIDEDRKTYQGFLYPTDGRATRDVLKIMENVRVQYHGNINVVTSKDGRVDKYLNAQLRKEKGKIMGCKMAYDYRGRFYYLDWINPSLQQEIRERFTFEDGSKIHWIDATASGVQMLSILSRCEVSARACNLINSGEKTDPYKAVAASFNKTREEVKKPLMTSFYGSTKCPEEAFGDDVDEFYAACSEALPGAYDVNQGMMLLHLEQNEERTVWEWEMPDGFKVDAKVYVTEFEQIDTVMCGYPCSMIIGYRRNRTNKGNKFLSANVAHSLDSFVLREVIRLASMDSEKLAGFINDASTRPGSCRHMGYLSLAHLHAAGREDVEELLDLQLMLESMEPFQIVPIHDCMGVKEEHIEHVQRLYRYVLAKLVSSSYPEYLKDLFGVQWHEGNLTEQEVLESRYALCEE